MSVSRCWRHPASTPKASRECMQNGDGKLPIGDRGGAPAEIDFGKI